MAEDSAIEVFTLTDGETTILNNFISQLKRPATDSTHAFLPTSKEKLDDDLRPDEPFSKIRKDFYNDEKSEQQFLKSKPTCFIIFGKPGAGKTQLAKQIARQWNCELINPQELINQELEQQTFLGQKCFDIISKGELILDELTFKIMNKKINSPEVAHHGYILDGLPTISQEFMTTTEQIDWIKKRDLSPDVIINLKIPDEDLLTRRTNQKYDSMTGVMYPKEVYDPERVVTVDEEDEEQANEEEVGEDTEELSAEDLERLIQQPVDMEAPAKDSIEKYKLNTLRIIEDYIISHDQQYVLELDANQPAQTLIQDCLMKFECCALSSAAVVQALNKEEEVDDIDSEAIFKTFGSKEVLAGQYTWKRSRWSRFCPVSLYEGNIIKGKTEYAVGLQAMELFTKNPRPYLLHPQPRPPCKLVVLGLPKSGKTNLCYLLAKKYNAKVIDMEPIYEELMKFRVIEKHQEWLEEATTRAIAAVKKNVEQAFLERLAEEANEQSENAEEEHPEIFISEIIDQLLERVELDIKDRDRFPSDEDDNTEDLEPEVEHITEEEIVPEELDHDELTKLQLEKELEEVDEDNEEVKIIVEKLMLEYAELSIAFTPRDQYQLMERVIQSIEMDNGKESITNIRNGGWILDNFPLTQEHWQLCSDFNLIPDTVICLIDTSDQWSWLMHQWAEHFFATVKHRKAGKYNVIEVEVEEEEEEEEEEEFYNEDTGLGKPEGRQLGEENAEEELEQEQEEEEEGQEEQEKEEEKLEKDKMEFMEEAIFTDGETEITLSDVMYKESSEEYRKSLKIANTILSGAIESVKTFMGMDPVIIPIENQTTEDIFMKVVEEIEKPFKHEAIEYSVTEMEEDDANYDADMEEDEKEEEDDNYDEEEEDPRISKKRLLGDVSHYCPVMLKEKGVLISARHEVAVRYDSKLYYLTSIEISDQFVAQPEDYTPKDKPFQPPPLRICILGAHGSGKTVYGRYIANKLGIFHISFKEKLQELIIKKTGRKIGPLYEEDTATDYGSLSDEDSDNKNKEVEEQQAETFTEPEELTEDEECIRHFLEANTPLSSDLLSTIISPWWFEEPYRSVGFVLEGYPSMVDDVSLTANSGCFPEVAIILNIEAEDVINRLLPARLNSWKTKRDAKLEKVEKKKDQIMQERSENIEKRRMEILNELTEKQKAAEEEGKEEDPDEEMDIESTLLEEFPLPEDDRRDEFETEDDARARFSKDISTLYEAENSEIEKVRIGLEDQLIPTIIIDANQRQHIVNYILMRSLKPYVTYRQSLFERVYPVNESTAKSLLHSGYKLLSHLGYWCPVMLKEGNSMLPYHGPNQKRVACIYRQYIYFLSSVQAREEFSKNPLYYLEGLSPKLVVPVKLSIIGPPKSGKTYFCHKLAAQFGLMKLSMGDAVRNVLENQPKTFLAQQILSYLIKGLTVPDELAVKAIETALLDVTAQTRGYVFDGIPATDNLAKLLDARKIIPVKVLVLNTAMEETAFRGSLERVEKEASYSEHNSAQILATKHQVYKKENQNIQDWYQKTFENLCIVIGQQSKWALWNEIKEAISGSVEKVQSYLENVKKDQAARLQGLCITKETFFSRLGEFHEYCPVTLALDGELADCSKDESMNLVAEYQGKYYKMENEARMETFLNEPQKFVPPYAPMALPPQELIPQKCLKKEETPQFEYFGYCPVTYYEGKCRYEAITLGQPDLVAEYQKKYYCFASEEKLEKFMRLPQVYSKIELSYKLPPKPDPLMVNLLPNLGFMEQSLSTPILRALVAVGNFKPKFPFLSPTQSALLYVAFHLKAFNKQKSGYIRKKYKQKLKNFEENCNLIAYLSSNMSESYQKTDQREFGFTEKLETFFALKDFKQNSIWIA
ncbi:Hypothetical predicted protein [Octopus vulgaris]|uniref:Adenylate kinase 9 n=2 Tax=Octopus vulgaris TaxID=6645 RepID=A0AA36BNX1_OCTVU|nr:Hypothetical predicted protein [Octopus vulgaris]